MAWTQRREPSRPWARRAAASPTPTTTSSSAEAVDVDLTRRLVERAVAGAVDGHLTARRPPGDGVALTVVHDASGASIEGVARALRPWLDGAGEVRLPSGVELDLDAGDGVLIAELRGGASPVEGEDPARAGR